MGKILLAIGLAGLCHAAYSATQHRNYLRLTESINDFSSTASSHLLPIDILVQTLVCLLLCCFGVISIAAKFKPIQITSEWENKVWDNIGNRTSFYSFNHRGKLLFSGDDDNDDFHHHNRVANEEENAQERELLRRKFLERNHQRKILEQQRLFEQQRILDQEQEQRGPQEEEDSGKIDIYIFKYW